MEHWQARGIDLSNVLRVPEPGSGPLRRTQAQVSPLPAALDWQLIELAQAAIDDGTPVTGELGIRNVNRTVGGLLSHHVTKRHGAQGLPPGSIQFGFSGSAGQSFGAWLAPGIELTLFGDTNDYAGKGLSGGVIAVRPPAQATFAAEDNVIVGNTVLYGAVGGAAFFRGRAGERFAVRNSGANAVVEGLGDHGCEYMTGGRVVVLGATGRNFAAGMSGGIAYVLDTDGTFSTRCNPELVDLEPLEEQDAETIRSLVEQHLAHTDSPVAARVLGEWDRHLPLFVKVMPRDYKRALAALQNGHPRTDVVSSGGEGFLTTESESARAAV
jgi:glutamate synthase (NADPH) large chain